MTVATGPTWEETLKELNQRDGALELSGLSHDPAQGVPPVFRVRLLAFGPGGLIVDRPGHAEEAHYFQPQAVVRLLAVIGQNRWELITTVDSRVKFRMNETTVVPALKLAPPHEVQSVQRREYFRVSTAGVELPGVHLKPLLGAIDPAFVGPSPAVPPFKARLLNIGGGGLGAECPQGPSKLIHYASRFNCTLDLPSLSKPLVVPATLVHLAPQPQGTCYLGLRFDPQGQVQANQCTDQVCQFTTWLQRQQLQRLREKR